MQERYGIITEKSHHVPGDERSRTNPGHGYPARTVTQTVLEEFDSKEKWESEIRRRQKSLYTSQNIFRAVVFREVGVKTVTTVVIDQPPRRDAAGD